MVFFIGGATKIKESTCFISIFYIHSRSQPLTIKQMTPLVVAPYNVLFTFFTIIAVIFIAIAIGINYFIKRNKQKETSDKD
jgi:hypothetical protein